MSAETLRKAAALMRADAATEAILRDGDPYYAVRTLPDGALLTEMSQFEMRWHPAVALAVADVLMQAHLAVCPELERETADGIAGVEEYLKEAAS